jgi:lysyl-tRNA synthetase class 2
MVERGLDPA